MMVAGMKLPPQDVLLWFYYWSKKGSVTFRFCGTDLVCNPSHSGFVFPPFLPPGQSDHEFPGSFLPTEAETFCMVSV